MKRHITIVLLLIGMGCNNIQANFFAACIEAVKQILPVAFEDEDNNKDMKKFIEKEERKFKKYVYDLDAIFEEDLQRLRRENKWQKYFEVKFISYKCGLKRYFKAICGDNDRCLKEAEKNIEKKIIENGPYYSEDLQKEYEQLLKKKRKNE